MAYITDAELKTYAAACLKASASGNLAAYLDTIIPIANLAAYNEIRRRLIGRGYETADIDAWDQRLEFSYDLGMCRILRDISPADAPDNWQQKFCRAEELDTIDIIADGEIVEPVADAGQIGYGESDVFDPTYPWEPDE